MIRLQGDDPLTGIWSVNRLLVRVHVAAYIAVDVSANEGMVSFWLIMNDERTYDK